MIAEGIRSRLKGLKYFPRGVHPAERKEPTRDRRIEPVPWPAEVVIPLQQHIGAPAQLAVNPRQEVKCGDVLGTAGGFVSAPVHASVDGKTAALTTALIVTGRRVPAVPIQTAPPGPANLEDQLREFLAPPASDVAPVDRIEPERIVEAAKQAGLVGLGGATFPTHVKLTRMKGREIDTVVLNGSECEPCLTADDRLMREAPELIVRGLLLVKRATGARRAVIAIEDNKPEAFACMEKAAAGLADIEVVRCLTKYPMGGERQLLPAVLGRAVPTGGLPLDVGVVVSNVATALALAQAFDRGRPLTHRILTVTGAVNRPGNYFVPIGTAVSWVIEQAGGLRPDAAEVIMGGPMMGVTLPDLAVPVTKGTGGLTVLTKAETARRPETACIRCGRCVDHCPLNLVPTKLAHAVKFGDMELAQRYDILACCECGCCAYVCPAGIPLVQYLKTGKGIVLRAQAKKKAAEARQ